VPLEELEAAVRQSAGSDLDETADAIRACIERHRPTGSGDDSAILVLRLAGTPLSGVLGVTSPEFWTDHAENN